MDGLNKDMKQNENMLYFTQLYKIWKTENKFTILCIVETFSSRLGQAQHTDPHHSHA